LAEVRVGAAAIPPNAQAVVELEMVIPVLVTLLVNTCRHFSKNENQNKMKKQIKKLNLSKRTISNLNASEMSNKIGGGHSGNTCHCGGNTGGYSKNCTQNQNTCPGHATCA
jgi:natural product precursor